MSGPGPATITRMRTLEVETPHGLARAHLHGGEEPRAALALGHGAAGGVASRDLAAVTDGALSEGLSVTLVEQPYKSPGADPPLRRVSSMRPGRE